MGTWPLLPLRIQRHTAWHDLVLARAPRRQMFARMDEAESILASGLTADDGDRFAHVLFGVFAGGGKDVAQACPHSRAWARVVRAQIVSPAVLSTLKDWASTRVESLDTFYLSLIHI